MAPTERLASGKITLRALEPEDLDLLYEWENNRELWEISNTRAPFSRFVLAQYLKDSARDVFEAKQVRLIIQAEGNKAVGAVDLYDIDLFHQHAGVGILIHNKEDRQHGRPRRDFRGDAVRGARAVGVQAHDERRHGVDVAGRQPPQRRPQRVTLPQAR